MKSIITKRVLTIILLSAALIININNLNRRPGDKIILLSIVLLSIAVGGLLNDLVREYSQKKKDDANRKF